MSRIHFPMLQHLLVRVVDCCRRPACAVVLAGLALPVFADLLCE
jgi:hypothetical protein